MHRMLLRYILSSRFDYNSLISGAAGTPFAKDYGWQTAMLENLRDAPSDVAVVDHRFVPDEIDALREVITNSKITFVLRLVDPYFEYARDHWWYRFVSEMLDHSRVHIMLNYQPAEFTALLASCARRSQFLFAPYVYRRELELPGDHEKRVHAMLLSGAREPALYPLRAQMHRVTFSLALLAPHDQDASSSGLSRPSAVLCATDCYKGCLHHSAGVVPLRGGMLLAVPTRVLKYREFAYAGVAPVGDMPATLLDCPADAWVPWQRNFVALTQTLRNMPAMHTAERAESFRRFMRDRRHLDDMRARVTEQLARLR